MKVRLFFGISFLIIQLFSIIYARFIPERFFCWAPYDQHTYYEVVVEINGSELTRDEILQRYNYKPVNWEPRSIDNVFNIIKQYESTYGVKDKAQVLVTYSINAKMKKHGN